MAADGPSERDPLTPATVGNLSKPTLGSTWTDLETTHLVDVYEEKWNSSKRGSLRAKQWEDVAGEVAARCGLTRLSKSGTQCRHKIEKLRKRYRSERVRPVRSLWSFFDRIDRMERGPLPISCRPPPAGSASSSSCSDFKPHLNNKRIFDVAVLPGNAGVSRNARRRRKRDEEEDEEDSHAENEEEVDEEGSGGRGGLTELAAELRRFGEGYVRMERKRIEMMREKEREWMEMESRRLEMVMEAQRGLVETIAGAFWKKAKSSEDF